jgi:hypothetical protein
MTLSRLPGVKDLLPYLIVSMVAGVGAMWLRLGECDKSCDDRVELAEKSCREKEAYWQAKFDRQDARIDSASVKIERLMKEQVSYFRILSNMKK